MVKLSISIVPPPEVCAQDVDSSLINFVVGVSLQLFYPVNVTLSFKEVGHWVRSWPSIDLVKFQEVFKRLKQIGQ